MGVVSQPAPAPEEPLDLPQARAQIAGLERALARQRAVRQELEHMLEDKTRDLFVLLEEVKRQARAIRSHAAAATVRDAHSLETAAPKMLQALGESIGWDFAALWLVDDKARLLRCGDLWTRPGFSAPRFAGSMRQMTFARGVGLPGRVWETQKAHWVTDCVADANFPRAPLAAAEGLHGGCAFPIVVAADVVGVVEFFSTTPRDHDAEMLETLAAIGTQISRTLEDKRLERALRDADVALARRIQKSILPGTFEVPGLEIGARMSPADDVGGDYYDVVRCDDGCWVGIGDVSGHGLGAGLVMLMVQSATGALCRAATDGHPRDLVRVLNSLLFENIQSRLASQDHVTFSLLRYRRDGSVEFSGAHEDLIVLRAATGRCELVETKGKWLGVVADLGPSGAASTLRLMPGDLLVLYTDGVTEAMSAAHEHFGIERVTAVIESLASEPAPVICEGVIAAAKAWGEAHADDMTVVALRQNAHPR